MDHYSKYKSLKYHKGKELGYRMKKVVRACDAAVKRTPHRGSVDYI